ncbi:hypothetical protein PVAP13_9KG376950 [Panicum virgatum]|uniref:Uncharacterized protein n=1 Tax=Panicum virgatum TaxID=38727 RepID=A0A8T0NY02_PANVG|nr:hypothetical protein PVAP13_9KG376950 [Panicum virgatum]
MRAPPSEAAHGKSPHLPPSREMVSHAGRHLHPRRAEHPVQGLQKPPPAATRAPPGPANGARATDRIAPAPRVHYLATARGPTTPVPSRYEEEKKKKEEFSGSIWRQRGPVRLDERSEPARLPCGGGDAKHRSDLQLLGISKELIKNWGS